MSSEVDTSAVHGVTAGDPAAGRHRRLRGRALGVAAAATVLLALVVWQRQAPHNEAIDSSREVAAAELEDEYGVRVGVIGLLASGGLVEMKFQVTDADKATALFGGGDVAEMPVLAVQGTDTVLMSAKGHKHTNLQLLDGGTYFLLYTNVGNRLHAGSKVAFVLNGVRLADLPVLQ